jgi:hypothetical protein
MFEGGTRDIEVSTTDIVDSFVVDEECTVRVFDGAVGAEDCVVGFYDGGGDAGGGVDGEFEFGFFAIVSGEAFEAGRWISIYFSGCFKGEE